MKEVFVKTDKWFYYWFSGGTYFLLILYSSFADYPIAGCALPVLPFTTAHDCRNPDGTVAAVKNRVPSIKQIRVEENSYVYMPNRLVYAQSTSSMNTSTRLMAFWWLLPLMSVSCQRKENSIRPQYRPLTEAVYASGQVTPRDEYTVFAAVNGYLTNRLVDEGDSVTEGQLLFTIKSDQQQLQAQTAYAQYQLAKSNYAPVLQELEAALESARARLMNDSVEHERYRNLYENKAATLQTYQQRTLAYQTAKNEYAAQQSRYNQTKNQLAADLQNARNQYRISAEQTTDYKMRSQMAGKVYTVYREPGEFVKTGEPIAQVGKADALYLRLNVDELDIDKVAIGQKILVTMDTYGNRILEATLTKIYPMLDEQTRTFRVDADFTRLPDEPMFAGLTAEANIVIRHKTQALTIPRSYVAGEDSVRIEDESGDVKTVKITKGVASFDYVEVLAGLDTNTVVLTAQ